MPTPWVGWVTRDGVYLATREEAEQHERDVEIRSELDRMSTLLWRGTCSAADMACAIWEHRHDLWVLLDLMRESEERAAVESEAD